MSLQVKILSDFGDNDTSQLHVQSDETTDVVVAKKSGFQFPASQGGASRKNSFVAPNHDVETVRPERKVGKKAFQSSSSKTIIQKKGVTSMSSKKTNEKNKRVNSFKKTKKKDFPNAPKRPMNAYMYFTETARKG